MRIHPYLILGALLLASVEARAETMYVKSPTAELKSSTSANAQILAQFSRGTSLNVILKQGNWIQVQTGGKKGWVYKFKLSPTKPSGGDNLLAGLGGGGASAREGSSAASIRGLSPTSEKYAGRANIQPQHVEMVKHMESMKVSQNQVQEFLKAGKLGEYQE